MSNLFPDNSPNLVRNFSYGEKQKLSDRIKLLDASYLPEVIDIINSNEPEAVMETEDAWHFEIMNLKVETLLEINAFVGSKLFEQQLKANVKQQQASKASLHVLDKGNLDSETRLKRTRSQTKLKDPSKAKKSKADADQEQTFSIDTQSIWKCQNCTLENQMGSFKCEACAANRPSVSSSRNNIQEKTFKIYVELHHSGKESKAHRGNRFFCTYGNCGKAFLSNADLVKHIRTHTGEKPFKCTEPGCHKDFADKSNLSAHMRRHKGIKKYVCQNKNCGKAYGHPASLKEHMWRHYGIQPYVCEYCGRRFGQASNFARHKKKQHKNDIPKYPCLDPSCQSTLFETTEELRIHVQSSHPNFDPENLQVHLQNFSIEALSSTSPSPSPIENGARQASANSLRSHSPFSQSTIQEQFTPEVCLPQSQVPTTLMPKRPILVRQDSSFDVVMDSFLKTEQGLAIQNSIQELDFAPEEPLGLSRDNSLFQLGLID